MDAEGIFVAPGIFVAEAELQESFVRASGPGGQNVNKVSTAVELRLDVPNAAGLPPEIKPRLLALAGRRATKDGVVVIFADRFRTQDRNRTDARDRLAALIAKAAEPPPPPRRKTRPTKGAVERRLKEKAGRAGVKRMRRRVADE